MTDIAIYCMNLAREVTRAAPTSFIISGFAPALNNFSINGQHSLEQAKWRQVSLLLIVIEPVSAPCDSSRSHREMFCVLMARNIGTCPGNSLCADGVFVHARSSGRRNIKFKN